MKSRQLAGCSPIFVLLFLSGCKAEKESAFPYKLGSVDLTAAKTPDSLRYLLPILDTVWYDDQKFRYVVSHSKKVRKMNRHSDEIQEIQNKNLFIVTGILDRYGWLGPDKIGFRGSSAIFAVLQHADLRTQEKYLPMIREALEKRAVMPSMYAMMKDRIEIRNHRPQIYGTQLVIGKRTKDILPLLNADSVDSWRRSIRMIESMETYLKRFQVQWDLQKYKKDHPMLIRKYKIKDSNSNIHPF